MKLLCALVGHQPPVYARKGWFSPSEEYGSMQLYATDGIGRVHVVIKAECARCGEQFTVARAHLTDEVRQAGNRAWDGRRES